MNNKKYNIIGGIVGAILGIVFSYPLIAGAINITVPSASGSGFLLQSTSTGQYLTVSLTAGTGITIATTTSNITITNSGGSIGSGTTGQFPFYNSVGTTLTATSSLFVSQAQNIGISTTTPLDILTIDSPVAGKGFSIYNSASNSSNFKLRTFNNSSTNRDWMFATNFSANGNLEFRVGTAQGSDPYASGTSVMTMLSGGNIGIGMSPSFKLDVNGTMRGTSLQLSDANVLGWGGTSATIYGSNASDYVRIQTGGVDRLLVNTSGNTSITGALNVTGLTTLGNATTTNISASNELNAPHSATVPTLTAGDLYVNTNSTASSSVATNDGTTQHTFFAVHTVSTTLASSTLVYMGSFGASGTTTLPVTQSLHSITIRSFGCSTDQGTAWLAFGTGSATTTAVQCTTSGKFISPASNNTFVGRQLIKMDVGTSASSPNTININVDVEDSN